MDVDSVLEMTPVKIETLVLAAVWKYPFIFQGYFKIAKNGSQNYQLLLFRCEYIKSNQMDVIDDDFSPYDYHFTALYNEPNSLTLDSLSQNKDDIYLLKYALHTTLCQMIKNTKHHFVSMDEIAMQSIIKIIQPSFSPESLSIQTDNAIGFAVSMDFSPAEKTGQSAVLALLGKINTKSPDDLKIH